MPGPQSCCRKRACVSSREIHPFHGLRRGWTGLRRRGITHIARVWRRPTGLLSFVLPTRGNEMDDDTISTEPSALCPRCGSSNWLVDQGDGAILDAERRTKRGDRACNECGYVWTPHAS